jgi:hypothetical protein
MGTSCWKNPAVKSESRSPWQKRIWHLSTRGRSYRNCQPHIELGALHWQLKSQCSLKEKKTEQSTTPHLSSRGMDRNRDHLCELLKAY